MDEQDQDELEFERVFPPDEFPYTRQSLNHVAMQRNKLDGSLIFDLLATNIAAVPDDLYPPRDISVLHDLYVHISASDADILKKQCLVYYICKDFSDELADRYATDVTLPDGHRRLIDGAYAFDQFDFKTAMANLTHPSASLQFTEKIFSALLRYCETGPQYIRLYMAVKSPHLSSPEAKMLYLDAICRVSIISALEFVRTTPVADRATYINAMIDYSLSYNTENAYHIANLPLTLEEEHIVLSSLVQRNDAISKNITVVRELHRGNVDNAKAIAGSLRKTISFGTGKKVQWTAMAQKLKTSPEDL